MADDLAQLPWLLVHGHWVWKLGAPAVAVVAIGLGRRWAARQAVRATAAERATRLARVTAPAEGSVTVRGVLRGGEVASTYIGYAGRDRHYASDHPARRWLDCDGERVELNGELRVVRGARITPVAAGPRSPVQAAATLQVPGALRRLAAWISVDDGDEVIATGWLARAPAQAASSYREATSMWRAEGAIELVAEAPVTRQVAMGAVRTAAVAIAAMMAVLAVAAGIGAGALALANADPGMIRLGQAGPLALAGLLPGGREPALATLNAQLSRRLDPAGTYALQRAVADARGCDRGIAFRIAHDDLDGLDALAADCDDAVAASHAFQLLGRFADAARREAELSPARRTLGAQLPTSSARALGRWYETVHPTIVTSPAQLWLAGNDDILSERPCGTDPEPLSCRLVRDLAARQSWALLDSEGELPEGAPRELLSVIAMVIAPYHGYVASNGAALTQATFDRLITVDPSGLDVARVLPPPPDDPDDTYPPRPLYVGTGWHRNRRAMRALLAGDIAMAMDAATPGWGLSPALEARLGQPSHVTTHTPLADAFAAARAHPARTAAERYAARHEIDPSWDALDHLDDPLVILQHAALCRDLAGDPAIARRWQDVVDRYLAVYGEPKQLLRLLVIRLSLAMERAGLLGPR